LLSALLLAARKTFSMNFPRSSDYSTHAYARARRERERGGIEGERGRKGRGGGRGREGGEREREGAF